MKINELIRAAIAEDMPHGDLTTESLGLTPQWGTAKLMAKSDLVLSGSYVFDQTLLALEPTAQLTWHFEDGQQVLAGQTLCTVQGDLLQILKGERIALNFLMRLSGIASFTRLFVDQVQGTKCRILDTRKTLPGYRDLEKKAVAHGGGENHRNNLSAALLVKDNHISVMGGITNAVHRIRSYTSDPMVVEASSIADVQECVTLKVERILLDNLNNDQIAQALKIIPSAVLTEASGNMNLQRVKSVAFLGVDYISVGALTHSAPSSDISLKFEWTPRP